MDVWKLTQKFDEQDKKLNFLIERISEIESCLNVLIKEANETIQDKEDKSQGVRAKRSSSKKSKASK